MKYDQDTKRYIRARFAQKHTDFFQDDPKDYHNYTFTNAKDCHLSDFLNANKFAHHEEKMTKVFLDWEGYTILCPNYSYPFELKETD